MEKKIIRRVKEFSIGDIVEYEGEICKIVEFPTRYSVVLKNLNQRLGNFMTAKISIKSIKK